MKILCAGIIARYPFGGVTWCSVMYLLGLRALGHEVLYVEDTGECIYDPVLNTRSEDPGYGTRYIHDALAPFGLGDRWSFVNFDGAYHGASRETVQAFCADADLFINLSGGAWFWRDEYARIPRRVFIDSDPVFTQLALAKGDPWYVDFFRGFTHLFTFGANIGTPACDVPTGGLTWHKTWQPVVIGEWQAPAVPAGDRFTTIMTWKIESFTDVDGNKDKEFVKFLDVARRTPHAIELAVNGPQDFLRAHGWTTVDAMGVSRSLWDYRAFIQGSKAEFGVAKHAYVSRRSGWFSDRTECYLAAGRPALVQDTGWSAHLPEGVGLLAFSTPDEALAGLDRIATDYPRHAARASEIARECFDAPRVLPALLEDGEPMTEPLLQPLPRPLRIAQVAPVGTAVPPPLSGSIETMTSVLTEGLVARGHHVTLFATADSVTGATLHATFPRGYREDPTMWPWELCELFNLSAAFERAAAFDVIHCQSAYAPMSLAFGRLVPTPVLHTVHHSPTPDEVRQWQRYPEAAFVAVSHDQAARLAGLTLAGIVPHGLDPRRFAFRAQPDDYLLFLGRFTEGKGVVQAIAAARRLGMRLLLAAQENDYYRAAIAPLVDGVRIVYAGEVGHAEKVALLGGARALLYPVQAGEPFGLVLTEAMACGTPVAAFDAGAVREVVDDGVTGGIFASLEALVTGMPRVLALDRAVVRATAVNRFSVERMVDGYLGVYAALVGRARAGRV